MLPPVVLLDGTSSSGKTTLARALQQRLAPSPWLHLALDDVFRQTAGDLPLPGGLDRLVAGYIRSVRAYARAGNAVIADTVLTEREWARDWSAVMRTVPVLAVAVRCDVEECERRARERGDRPAGLARRQAVSIHAHLDYDIDVDTSTAPLESCVAAVTTALAQR